MADIKQFRLPDVGEGLVEAEIVSWKVKPGDTVQVNTVLVEIETAKSLVELPCPWAGVVTELLVDEGTTVDVGTPIISVDVGTQVGGGASPGAPAAGSQTETPTAESVTPPAAAATVPDSASEVGTPAPDEPVEPGMIGGPAEGPKTLVGYGPRAASGKRRPRKGREPRSSSADLHEAFSTARGVSQPVAPPRPPQPVKPVAAQGDGGASLPQVGTPAPSALVSPGRALAKPPVRKLAKDLGVDIASITPTGPQGTVTREDVLAASGQGALAGAGAPEMRGGVEAGGGERETRVPIRSVRKATAQAVSMSAFTAPHVTEFLTVDVTRTMRLVDRLREDREFSGVKVSPLLIVAKALLLAVKRNPEVNATWDDTAQEIVVKHYVNLGIAAATPRGLVVPNIKEAQLLSLRELADALGELTAKAREGKTQPDEMFGGTISITNVGVFGVDTGTPILPPGESAILAFGAVRKQPWVHKGKVKPRWVTTLGLSFDHRLIDGDLGSRFLADIGAVLEHPDRALLWA
ncbi:MAG TPA: 2-oxo acid dehydrogenase subunit E2 [Actinomycetales bacterium]|nr:2-oxo acid dehydrogenase subunit E2 [Actinomycetales bacterium]